MFGGKKDAQTAALSSVQHLRADAVQQPAPQAVVNVGLFTCLRVNQDLRSWLRYRRTVDQFVWTNFFAAVLFLGFAGAAFWAARWLANLGVAQLDGMMALSDGQASWVLNAYARAYGVAKDAVNDYPVVPVLLLAVFVYLLLKFMGAVRGLRRWFVGSVAQTDTEGEIILRGSNAGRLQTASKDILVKRLPASVVEQISNMKSDRDEPYRIIRGIANVPPSFLRMPREVYRGHLLSRQSKRHDSEVNVADTLCAGVLGMVGAFPAPRFDGHHTQVLAADRYWREDVQEVCDSSLSDIFLRFHQTTTERSIPPLALTDACTYRAYVVLSNFRCSPLFLLRVSDVVHCLTNERGDYDETLHALCYRFPDVLNKDNVVETLMESKYAKPFPRAERYHVDREQAGGEGVILARDGDGYIMSFDPGRVWAGADADPKYRYAVMALRSAIHLASRKRAIEVTLRKNDVLVVDNLRMLIARREEAPGFSVRDVLAGAFPSLSGRWMRQLYGFEQSGIADGRSITYAAQ